MSYFQGFIYAIGGTDGWNCLGITEIYDIKSNKWVVGPSLNVNRRGAGCDVLNGKTLIDGFPNVNFHWNFEMPILIFTNVKFSKLYFFVY